MDWSTLFATMVGMLVVTVMVSGIPTAPTIPARSSKHIMSKILAVALISFTLASVLYYKLFKHFCYGDQVKNQKYLLFSLKSQLLYLNWYFVPARSAIEQ
jgi:hypothetical protein